MIHWKRIGGAVTLSMLLGFGNPFAQRIQPEQLVYLGAFRLPGESGGSTWEFGGMALCHYGQGDPSGPEDGFVGSLFGAGFDVR